MITKLAAVVAIAFGLSVAVSASTVAGPTCCMKNAYCCSVKARCCGTDVAADKTTVTVSQDAGDPTGP